MSGITFNATFPLVFEVRTAPPVDETNVSQQGVETTGVVHQ